MSARGPARAGRALLVAAITIGACACRLPATNTPTASDTEGAPEAGLGDEAHRTALLGLLAGPWGWRGDKKESLHVPLPDYERWRRVRFYGVPTFAGFRYGDDHDAVVAVWVERVEAGDDGSPEMCLDRFESWAEPQAISLGVELTEASTTKKHWAKGDIVLQIVEAQVDSIFGRRSYAGAYGAYAVWPGTCTIVGIAVLKKGEDELAQKVRDRYVQEGFAAMTYTDDHPPEL